MEYRRRPSLIGPLILITIGILFLLANLGMLPFTFWEIAYRFWPLILVLVGLEILFGRRSLFGALIVVVLWLALIGGVLWLAYAGGGVLPTSPPTTDQLVQPLGDIKSASVDLNIGTAQTFVSALDAGSTDLMNGSFRHAEGTRVVKTYDVVGSEGRLGLKEEGVNLLFGSANQSRWDVALSQQVPLALHLNGGLGRASLDLTALNVTALNLDASVGNIDVSTPKSGSTSMRVNGGVGTLAITIPQGVAAHIRVNGGIGSTRVDEARFPKSGDTYQSADYATAANKIDIAVDGGIGSISVR